MTVCGLAEFEGTLDEMLDKVEKNPEIDPESFTFTPVEGLILAEMMNSDDLE